MYFCHRMCPCSFHPPTNADGIHECPKYNYSEIFDHPTYESIAKVPSRNPTDGSLKRGVDGEYVYENTNVTSTIPNIDF